MEGKSLKLVNVDIMDGHSSFIRFHTIFYSFPKYQHVRIIGNGMVRS